MDRVSFKIHTGLLEKEELNNKKQLTQCSSGFCEPRAFGKQLMAVKDPTASLPFLQEESVGFRFSSSQFCWIIGDVFVTGTTLQEVREEKV